MEPVSADRLDGLVNGLLLLLWCWPNAIRHTSCDKDDFQHRRTMLDDGEIIMVVTIVSTLSCLWSMADNYLQNRFQLARADAENVLSLFHAIVTLHATDTNLGKLEPATFYPTAKTTLSEEICLLFSCSYFLYDTFRWKFRGPASKIMLSHHVCSIFAIMNNLAEKSWGTHGNMALLVLEASNPLLHFRRILIGEGLKDRNIYTIGEWSFLISFVVFRFILGIRYINFINTIQAPKYLVKTAYMLCAISSVFLVRIIVIMKAKIVHFLKGDSRNRQA